LLPAATPSPTFRCRPSPTWSADDRRTPSCPQPNDFESVSFSKINRNKFTTNPRDFVKNPPNPKLAEKWEGDGWVAQGHIENWFDCIKSRAKPNADVEIGHRTVTVGHLINIAREVGRKLRWDPEREQVVDDPEANALLDRPRRKGWELPQVD
jgi:hypothetical protein